MDIVQGALDVAGLAPVVGLPADLLNAGISAARGNYTDAALSMAAAVPLAGTVAGIAKIAKSAKKVFKKVTKKLKRSPKFSKYEDVTKGKSIHNRETDVSMDDFIDNLTKAGYARRLSSDGKATVLTKGNKKYSIIPSSKSTGKPTAVYSVRGGKKMKIRLDQ